MGVMTDAVGYDCSNCHPGAGTDSMDWVSDAKPEKRVARKMVDMVAAINKERRRNANGNLLDLPPGPGRTHHVDCAG